MFPFSPSAIVHLTGESQILDKDGNMIARRGPEEGAGVVIGDIEIARVKPRAEIPDRFWLPPKLGFGKLLWWHQHPCGKAMYKRANVEQLTTTIRVMSLTSNHSKK